MSIVFRPSTESPALALSGHAPARHWPRRRSAWRSGVVALALIGVLGLVLAMAALRILGQPVAIPAGSATLTALALARPLHTEAATLGGMDRALAVMQRDLGGWQRLLAPADGFDLAPPRGGMAEPGSPGGASAATGSAPTRTRPDRLALVILALTLATMTLLAGLAALVAERRLLAPFRALRLAACAIAEGRLDQQVPGTERHDEAGALARSLEHVRIAGLAWRDREEAGLDAAGLSGAGCAIEAATRQIQRISAEAGCMALDCALVLDAQIPAEAGRQAIAQGVRDLAGHVTAIRESGRGAAMAVDDIIQAIGALDEALRQAPLSDALRGPHLPGRAESLAAVG